MDIFHIYNTSGNHLYQGETFAEAGYPFVSFVISGVSGYEAVSTVTWGKGIVNLLRMRGRGFFKYLTGDVGGEIIFYKILE